MKKRSLFLVLSLLIAGNAQANNNHTLSRNAQEQLAVWVGGLTGFLVPLAIGAYNHNSCSTKICVTSLGILGLGIIGITRFPRDSLLELLSGGTAWGSGFALFIGLQHKLQEPIHKSQVR